jgi:hypothetical protein
LPVARSGGAESKLGPWATLAWSAVALATLFTVPFVQMTANAWAGHPVRLPAWMYEFPVGHAMMLAIVLLAIGVMSLNMRDYLGLVKIRHAQVWAGIGIGIATFVGMIGLFIVTGLIQKMIGGGAPSGEVITFKGVGTHKLELIIVIYGLMVIAAPIVEEIFFRGFMYRGLAESRMGVVGALVVTSIIFGLAHAPGFGWQRVVVTGCVGLLLGIIRWRTGGTSMGMVSHAATNFCGASVFAYLIAIA